MGCGCCCPSCLQVTFSGVAIDCGCLNYAPINAGFSSEFNEVTFNETLVSLVKISKPSCSPCFFAQSDLSVRQRFWTTSGTCTGIPFFDGNGTTAILLGLIGGVYYLFVHTGQFVLRGVLFYGSTTDLSVPITNEAFCSSPTTWDNPIVNCFFGSPQTFFGAAHDGIATIEVC